MTQGLDKIKTDKVRGPNSKLVTNGPEVKNENQNKIARTKWGVYTFQRPKTQVPRLTFQNHP